MADSRTQFNVGTVPKGFRVGGNYIVWDNGNFVRSVAGNDYECHVTISPLVDKKVAKFHVSFYQWLMNSGVVVWEYKTASDRYEVTTTSHHCNPGADQYKYLSTAYKLAVFTFKKNLGAVICKPAYGRVANADTAIVIGTDAPAPPGGVHVPPTIWGP